MNDRELGFSMIVAECQIHDTEIFCTFEYLSQGDLESKEVFRWLGRWLLSAYREMFASIRACFMRTGNFMMKAPENNDMQHQLYSKSDFCFTASLLITKP
jgi:hypothetical protein